MGYGFFDTAASTVRSAARAKSGDTGMLHDADVRAGKADALHPTMDPRNKPHRESRDSDDNPTSTPIAVALDVTGSNRHIAQMVLADLPKLMGVIQDQGIVPHPQLMFCAVGDATCDRVPFQIGEYETDDEKCEESIGNIYLEGGGGGQNTESYETMMWFFANRVDTDAWDKRGEKGFLFIIADEAPYSEVANKYLQQWFGVEDGPDLDVVHIAEQLQERFEVFCLRPQGGYFNDTSIINIWKALLPEERVIQVEDWKNIVPLIAGNVAAMTGMSIADIKSAMVKGGFDPDTAAKISTALVPADSSIVTLEDDLVEDTADDAVARV